MHITKLLLVLALVAGSAWPWAAQADAAALSGALRALSLPLRGSDDLTPLIEAIGDARWVLLGESSHGTREFYMWRDRLSRRLIAERGFSFIAIEGNWSALIPLDRYVRHHPDAPASAREALRQVERWPRWILANEEMVELGEWLRAFNRDRPMAERVGIHGIDVHGIWDSVQAVRRFFHARLPARAAELDRRYGPLLAFADDSLAYARHVQRTGRSARAGAAAVAGEIEWHYAAAPPAWRPTLFELMQHAKVVEYGERYLGAMGKPGPDSWNARTEHFVQTVARLLHRYGPHSRAIVWAHNTHVGDARATDMALTGELNIGQLARQRHADQGVFLVGLGTGSGSMLAARRWEGRRETMHTPPPRPDSLEAAFLAAGEDDRLLLLGRRGPLAAPLLEPVPHRAIGVVFTAEHERRANYVPTRLAERYDAFIFLPSTRALTPLHPD